MITEHTFCMWCGAYLRGGATRHKPTCWLSAFNQDGAMGDHPLMHAVDDTLREMVKELQRKGPMELTLQPQSVLHLCGILQLAMRHPKLGGPSRKMAEQFLAGARNYFHDAPTVLEILRRGDDPSEDQ